MTRKPTTSTAATTRPRGLRERARADGSVRLWWEPPADARPLGFGPVELPDAVSAAWAQATKLNRQVDAARATGQRLAEGQRQTRRIEDLIRSYRASVHWREKLKPKTRDSYAKLLGVIADKWGTARAAEFDKAVMHQWYQTLYSARGPRMAQALIRMMSILMEHAETLGWRPANANPCLRLKVHTPPPRARAASMAEIAAILAAAETLGLHGARTAILLSLLHGQRQTDVLTARRGDFALTDWTPPGTAAPRRVWVWRFTRSKRGNAAAILLHDDAVPAIRAALADAGTADAPRTTDDVLIRDEATGKPYSEFLFNKRWRAILAHAADKAKGNCHSAATLQFRDLRRTWAMMARAAGVSNEDVGDVLGNSLAASPLLEATYTPASMETTGRAIAAVQLPGLKQTKGPAA